jgi:hypothetical protein
MSRLNDDVNNSLMSMTKRLPPDLHGKYGVEPKQHIHGQRQEEGDLKSHDGTNA